MGIPTCPTQAKNGQTHTHANELQIPEVTLVSAFRHSRNGLAHECAAKADVHSFRPLTPRSRSRQSIEGRRVARCLPMSPGFHLVIPPTTSLKTPELGASQNGSHPPALLPPLGAQYIPCLCWVWICYRVTLWCSSSLAQTTETSNSQTCNTRRDPQQSWPVNFQQLLQHTSFGNTRIQRYGMTFSRSCIFNLNRVCNFWFIKDILGLSWFCWYITEHFPSSTTNRAEMCFFVLAYVQALLQTFFGRSLLPMYSNEENKACRISRCTKVNT